MLSRLCDEFLCSFARFCTEFLCKITHFLIAVKFSAQITCHGEKSSNKKAYSEPRDNQRGSLGFGRSQM